MNLAHRSWVSWALGLVVLCTAVGATAQGVNVELATADDKQKATADYRAGMKAFDEKKADVALELFRKSYNTVASPNSGLMIGRSLIALGRLSEAYAELEQVTVLADALARGNAKYATTAEAAHKELEELRPQLGFLTLSVPVQVSLNNTDVSAQQWGKAKALAPGLFTLRLRAGDQTSEQQVSVAAGGNQTLALELPQRVAPAPPPPAVEPSAGHGSGRTLGYVALGVGAAGLTTSAVFLVLNQSKLNDLHDACRGSECPDSVVEDIEASRSGETVALVGLGLGIVGVGLGAYFILSSDKPTADTALAQPRTALRVGLNNVQLSSQF